LWYFRRALSEGGLFFKLLERFGLDGGAPVESLVSPPPIVAGRVDPVWLNSAGLVLETEKTKCVKKGLVWAAQAGVLAVLALAMGFFVWQSLGQTEAWIVCVVLGVLALNRIDRALDAVTRHAEGEDLARNLLRRCGSEEPMSTEDPLWEQFRRFSSKGGP
jgi:hypothetical protein